MKEFCAELRKAREGAGYPSAYKFYRSNGGRGHFPFTFVHYARIEKGVSLPKPEWLELILLALRVLPVDLAAKRMMKAYLRDMLGGGHPADYVLSPLFGRDSGSETDPLSRLKRYSSEHITPEAFAVMTASPAAYWCAEALFNDDGAWTPPELAARMRLKPADAEKALKELEKCGLAARTGDGRYKCPQPGKIFSYPGRLMGMGPLLDKVRTYWENDAKRVFFERFWIGRASEGDMANYRNSLAQAIDSANNYASHSGDASSGFFTVETRVTRLKDF